MTGVEKSEIPFDRMFGTCAENKSPFLEGRDLAMVLFFVRAKGIEPIRLSAPDPKSGLSTNFNTPADFYVISFRKRSANILLIFESASITPKYKKRGISTSL